MLKRILTASNESAAILSFTVLFVVFTVLLRTSWIGNLPSMLRDVSWLGIVAIGQALLMISGEFDLSVGSVFAFVGMAFLLLMRMSVGAFPALVGALLIAMIIGLINGLVTWKFKIPSLLVTLGFLFIYRGFVHFISKGFAITVPDSIRDHALVTFLGGKLLGLHTSIFLFGLIIVIFMVILSQTRFGNHVFAVGGDARSALSCGVSPGRTKIITFVVCSLLAGLSGIIATCSLSSVAPSTGEGLEFEAIAAAVIGGCSLRGGVGTVWGTILGVGTLMALKAGLIQLGINIFVYQILLGLLLVSLIAIKGLLPRLFTE